MPRMAALIPADASENKEMPQRAGIAVIAPFPLASAADSNPPELAQRTKAGWGGEISFALGIPTVAGVQLRGDALNLLARSFFFGVEFTPRSWLVESVEAICACEEDLDTSRAPKN